MKLIEKIQKVRVALQNEQIKQSGKNAYAGYEYMELNDFLKPLNKLMQEVKMTAIVSFTNELATLTAYDFESEETLTISSPFSSANLKGCHEVQNVGAVETYQRRYLYQAMFDIAEGDALDGTMNPNVKKQEKGKDEGQVLCERCGVEIVGVRKKDGTTKTAEEVKEACHGLCVNCYKEETQKSEETKIKEVEVKA